MPLPYQIGAQTARDHLGLRKHAGVGNTQELIAAATGDGGRGLRRPNTRPVDQVSTAWLNHDTRMDRSHAARTEKTGAKASGYALHGRTTFQGLKISIEQRKGAVRKWKDESTGEEGSSKMLHPYGYIRMSEGTDGDHVDVYLGPNPEATHAFIVNQMYKPKTKAKDKAKWTRFDEQKVMLGFRNAIEAKNAYIGQYDDPRFFGSMIVMPMAEFKKKVLDRKYWGRKLASLMDRDMQHLRKSTTTTHHTQADKPHSGHTAQAGDTMSGTDTISRSFSDMDTAADFSVLDGAPSMVSTSPGV